jgi:hypothetical protein
VFCERCGVEFRRKQSVCNHCNVTATRHWFQLMSLLTLTAVVFCNAAVGFLVLPRLVARRHPRFLFRAWLWFDHMAALYGWIPLVLALLAWDYFVWKAERPKIKGWFTRKLLTFSLAAAVAPMLPWWVPAGQPPGEFLSLIGKYAGLPCLLAWGAVLVVTALLCVNAESRDRLLGHGKALSLVSLGLLLLVLTMTLVGWSIAY